MTQDALMAALSQAQRRADTGYCSMRMGTLTAMPRSSEGRVQFLLVYNEPGILEWVVLRKYEAFGQNRSMPLLVWITSDEYKNLFAIIDIH